MRDWVSELLTIVNSDLEKRGWANFLEVYRPLADHWAIYDNSESTPQLLERGP